MSYKTSRLYAAYQEERDEELMNEKLSIRPAKNMIMHIFHWEMLI